MTTNTPHAGSRIAAFSRRALLFRTRHIASLIGFSAFSFLFFLGASVKPVHPASIITIESAMEWNAFVNAGMGRLMGMDALHRFRLPGFTDHGSADGSSGAIAPDLQAVPDAGMLPIVITSYSIHYTKLYDVSRDFGP